MRQGPNTRRSRGRGGNNGGRRQNIPLRHQTFDSNGPDVRIRGNAFQVHEKYLALARDAQSSGDRIAAENYFQHAEHYFRIINQFNDMNGDGSRPRTGRYDTNGNGSSHPQGNGHGNGHGGNGFGGDPDDHDDDDGIPEPRVQLNA